MIAGRNFGCGSSWEEAPALLRGLSVSLVVADSFARLFFRNSINIGFPLLESSVLWGGLLRGTWEYEAIRLPEFLLNILRAGGAYKERRLERGR